MMKSRKVLKQVKMILKESIDNVENHIDLTGYDKDFWDRYDNLNSFKRYVLGLAVAGSGERKLLDQLKNMQEGINSLWKYLEKIDDLEDDDEEDVEDSTEMDDMSDKEVKDLARAYGIKGVRNKSISELRQEVEMLRLKELHKEMDISRNELDALNKKVEKIKPSIISNEKMINKLKKDLEVASSLLLSSQKNRDTFHQKVQEIRIDLINM